MGISALLPSCGGEVEQARLPSPGRPVMEQRQSVSDDPMKIGPPYAVNGVTYTPQDSVNYDEVGRASWYGEEQEGNTTASGEPFLPSGISAAHRTLPLPSYVEVTALDTGRTILVRINDRGPFSADRLIDLSRGAAEQLGIMDRGSTPVRVRRVNPPEQERAVLRNGGHAAERLETPTSLLTVLRKRLGESSPVSMEKSAKNTAPASPASRPAPSSVRGSLSQQGGYQPPRLPRRAKAAKDTSSHLAQVGAFSSRDRAETLARRIGGSVVKGDGFWRVRLGPYPSVDAARRAAASKGFAGAQIMANDAQ